MNQDAYRAAFHAAAVPFLLMTEDGEIIAANMEAHHLLGYSKNELLGDHVSAIMDKDSATKVPVLAWERRHGRYRLEGQVRRKLGSNISLAIQGCAIFDESQDMPRLTLIELDDMPDGSHSEDLLRESETRFKLVFEQAAVGIVFQGPPGDNFLRVNSAFAELLGYSREELYTRGVQELTHHDDVSKSLEVMDKVFSGDIPGSVSLEKRYLRRDGATIWCRVTISLARTAEGAPWFLVAVIQDISKQKHYESEMLQAFELVQRQKQRLDAILASLPDGLLILDQDMRVEEINEHLTLICPSMKGLRTGFPLSGQEEHMPADLLQAVLSLARQQREVMGFRFICKVMGGETKHLMVNASLVQGAEYAGMVFLVRDISDMPAMPADNQTALPSYAMTPPQREADASLRDTERRRILEALRRTDGNKAKAARLLGMGRTTLYRKMKVLGICEN